jgi:ribonuclease HII
LKVCPERILVDGNRAPGFAAADRRYSVEAIVRGDQSVPSISAASILAKVCRDRLMRRWHRRFPGYGFDRNKGYPTPAHLAGLEREGPCAIHRASFAPVRRLFDRLDL